MIRRLTGACRRPTDCVARKRNCASSGASLTALIVASSAGVFTPLRGSRGLACGRKNFGHGLSSIAAATTAARTCNIGIWRGRPAIGAQWRFESARAAFAATARQGRGSTCPPTQNATAGGQTVPSGSGAPLERAPHVDVIDYRIIPATSEFTLSTSCCETATKDGDGSVRLAYAIEPPA